MGKPLIFICYCREDAEWLRRLLSFIKIAFEETEHCLFSDQDIEAGEWWELRILEQIEKADFALLLLSVDALNSDFIRRVEIPLFQHFKRERGLRIIPIILRPCPYERLSWLRGLQALPADGEALDGRENLEVELNDIARRLVKIVEPGPGLQSVPERPDRASAPGSHSAADRLNPQHRYSGPTELRPEPEPNLRVAVRSDRTQPAARWHGLPDQYVQSNRSVGTEPRLGTSGRTLVQQPGTPGFIEDEDEHQSSSKQLLTEP
jgi:TIR domain-containing protein